MSRSSLTLLALILAVSACDREADPGAQQEENHAADKSGLVGPFAGEIDRSQAGSFMPALNLSDPAGKTLNLGALQGTPILVNLWATWCAPCIVEMPMLDDLAGTFDGRLRVVTVSQDLRGAELVEPFFATRDFRYLEPWLDPDNALGEALDNSVMPLTVLYDASGREVFRVSGDYPWDSEEAIAQIAEALAASGE